MTRTTVVSDVFCGLFGAPSIYGTTGGVGGWGVRAGLGCEDGGDGIKVDFGDDDEGPGAVVVAENVVWVDDVPQNQMQIVAAEGALGYSFVLDVKRPQLFRGAVMIVKALFHLCARSSRSNTVHRCY